jgi:putative oxidoreductase
MKYLKLAPRFLLGLIFFASGVAFFLTTPPPLPPGDMADFFKGIMATHYFIYLLKICEAGCGLLLLSGNFVPLALVILAPIILNIFLVNAFLMPTGLPLVIVIGALEVYLAFFSKEYSPTIKKLFQRRT